METIQEKSQRMASVGEYPRLNDQTHHQIFPAREVVEMSWMHRHAEVIGPVAYSHNAIKIVGSIGARPAPPSTDRMRA